MLAGRMKEGQDGRFLGRDRIQGGRGDVLRRTGGRTVPDTQTGRVAGQRDERVVREEPARVHTIPRAACSAASQRRVSAPTYPEAKTLRTLTLS